MTQEREVWGAPAGAAAPATRPRISGLKMTMTIRGPIRLIFLTEQNYQLELPRKRVVFFSWESVSSVSVVDRCTLTNYFFLCLSLPPPEEEAGVVGV